MNNPDNSGPSPESDANRLDRFDVPADLTGRTVVDIGCGEQALSIECLRRGARRVIGLDATAENIGICQAWAESLGVKDRCEFVPVDLGALFDSHERQQELIDRIGRPDIVFCGGVDAQVDRWRLFAFAAELTLELCYCETSSKVPATQFVEQMESAGFASVDCVSPTRAERAKGRQRFILDKKQRLSERLWQRRYRGYRFAERWVKQVASTALWERIGEHYRTESSLYDHKSYRLGDDYIREFGSLELWDKVHTLYRRIAHIPYVQRCDFSIPGRLRSPMSSRNVLETELTRSEKDMIRAQVIALVRMMNQAGVAHRDLHCGNLFFDNNQICLIDLEFLEEDRQSLGECYDLTGRGLPCPLKSGYMNVFCDHRQSIKNIIGLTPSDFGLVENGDVYTFANHRRAA